MDDARDRGGHAPPSSERAMPSPAAPGADERATAAEARAPGGMPPPVDVRPPRDEGDEAASLPSHPPAVGGQAGDRTDPGDARERSGAGRDIASRPRARLAWAIARFAATLAAGAAIGASATWATATPPPAALAIALRAAGIVAPATANGRTPLAAKAEMYDEALVTAIYERAAPSIVEVGVTTASGRRGAGSGVLVAPHGTVLTNFHVVRGASRVEITLRDRTRLPAVTLGTDPQDDIALLRVEGVPEGSRGLPLGDSDAIRPGAMAIAIGNPAGLDRSISVGVISGLGRTLRDGDRPMRNVIQVDATLNPGNSGGALLDSSGHVIGVTNAIERVAGRPGFGGIGFAVPSSSVVRNFERLLAGDRVRHAYVGISGQDLVASIAQELGLVAGPGIAVTGVTPDGPAAQAGMERGDAIVAVGNHRVTSMDEFGSHVDRTYRPGDAVPMEVRRGGASVRLVVVLGAWPDAQEAT